MSDPTPKQQTTPESYLGYLRIGNYAGSRLVPDKKVRYRLPPALPVNAYAYGGYWRVEKERIVAGRSARLRLHFFAKNVYLVLGGQGALDVLVDGQRQRRLRVQGISRL